MIRISIYDGGFCEFIYDDALASLVEEGNGVVRRASHVEPHPTQAGWLADMQPSGGPVLGVGCEDTPRHRDCDCDRCEAQVIALVPFRTRQDALRAEVNWLRDNRGL